MSSVPQRRSRATLGPLEEAGRRESFLARHGAAVCLILGFSLLGFVGVLALSPQLTCRLTGFDCAARSAAPQRIEAQRAITATPSKADDAAIAEATLRASLKWKAARDCAAAADACGARACYAVYLSETRGADAHAEEARREEARFAEICRPAPAQASAPSAMDGRYLARSQAACGVKPASVIVEVKGREISWRHEFQGVVYQWRGDVEASGAVRAAVGASPRYAASGSITDAERATAMVYPGCPEGIAMRVVNRLPD